MQNKRVTSVNSDRLWQALTKKRLGNLAPFFYGVRTTKVYCRALCASRLPNRGNVNFFASAEEAAQAGFRPCKRCRPQDAEVNKAHRFAVMKAASVMASGARLPLEKLARQAGISPHHFRRVFKTIMGVTPKDYAAALQSERFGKKLESGGKVSAALYSAGFGSSSRAYAAQSRLGMTPKARAKKGEGEMITYTIGQTQLGKTLVAVSEKGLCMTAFADREKELRDDIKKRFSNAALVEDKGGLKKWLDAVKKFLAAPADKLDLPLDLRGTAFQARVWRMLQTIPPGKTLTYSEVAKRLKQPKAVRAVASACGRNPVSLFVPCHRVIGMNGTLNGYRWGLKRKKTLLASEQGIG